MKHYYHSESFSHLSTLQVPPHGSFAADGEASVVQQTKEKYYKAENQTSWDT